MAIEDQDAFFCSINKKDNQEEETTRLDTKYCKEILSLLIDLESKCEKQKNEGGGVIILPFAKEEDYED